MPEETTRINFEGKDYYTEITYEMVKGKRVQRTALVCKSFEFLPIVGDFLDPYYYRKENQNVSNKNQDIDGNEI